MKWRPNTIPSKTSFTFVLACHATYVNSRAISETSEITVWPEEEERTYDRDRVRFLNEMSSTNKKVDFTTQQTDMNADQWW